MPIRRPPLLVFAFLACFLFPGSPPFAQNFSSPRSGAKGQKSKVVIRGVEFDCSESAFDHEKLPNEEFAGTREYISNEKGLPEAVRLAFARSFVRVETDSAGDLSQDNLYTGTGSVVAISPRIFVLTSLHIAAATLCDSSLPNDLSRVKIKIYDDGRPFPARLLKMDAGADLMIVEVETGAKGGFSKKPISISEAQLEKGSGPYYAFGLYSGDRAGAIKLPTFLQYGYETSSASVEEIGVLSGWIRPGFSGGCLLDVSGACHGVIEEYVEKTPLTIFTPASAINDLLKPAVRK